MHSCEPPAPSTGHATHAPFEHPSVEVLVEGSWYPGEIVHADLDGPHGTWTLLVQWRHPGTSSSHLTPYFYDPQASRGVVRPTIDDHDDGSG